LLHIGEPPVDLPLIKWLSISEEAEEEEKEEEASE
jgi:hypothetical protein